MNQENKYKKIKNRKTLVIPLVALFSLPIYFTFAKIDIGKVEFFGKSNEKGSEVSCNDDREFALTKGDNNSHCGGRVVIILKDLNDGIADIDFNMIPSFNQVKTGYALPFELNGENYELKITQVDSAKELMRYRIIPKS